MTAIISYANEYCSIIITDNRVNYGYNQEGGYEDGHLKLINLPDMGWVSGAGLADYLDILKLKLASSEIHYVADIEKVYEEVITAFKDVEPYWEDKIDASVMVASWVGFDGEKLVFRVGTMSKKHFDYNLMRIKENTFHIVYPGDFLSDESKIDHLNDVFKLDETDDDFFINLANMLKIFNHISLNSVQVSDTCDIGIQVLLNDDVYKFKISGDIEELISKAESEDLEEEMEIVSSPDSE